MTVDPTRRAPLATVATPACIAAQSVGEATSSVQTETLAGVGLLVVDDGSTRGYLKQLEAFADARIALVRQPQNGGEVAACNAGIERTRGNPIAILDAERVTRAHG